MIRILHAADLHLDSPFAALRPEQAAQRREEQRKVLVELVRECNRRGCDALLLAGDLFDSHRIYRETAELLCRVLKECRAQVFIAPGNHDYYDAGSPYASLDWPENVHIFRTPEIGFVRLDGLTVYGAGFTAPRAPALLRGFRAEKDETAVMVLHGELTPGDSKYDPISPEDAAASGLAYLALGHIHQPSVERFGRTLVGNPGCLIGRGFDETGEKGALYIEIEDGSVSWEAVPMGARQYLVLPAMVEGDPVAAALDVLPANAADCICRIILTGTCEAVRPGAVEEALEGRVYGLEVVDRTLPPLELWAGLGEDSLRGAFLRRLKEVYDRENDEEKKSIAALAARLALAVMEGREVPEE